ncbi:MAG TPA: sigma-70 family RNA polymerase sigma factor [Acidimicrobiia bacterium]|nr:sigma-70 family RNA polymerase sigma factor [Acidimicrobiia bacterium]
MSESRHEVRPRSFELFYRHERDRLVRILSLSLGDPAVSAEAVDEAMARAYARWRRVGSYASPQGWVYRVALNWARSNARKTRRERLGAVAEQLLSDPEPDDPRLLDRIGRLPGHQRSVVVLRYYADWSIDEIAAALQVRPGTVKSRLHRALAELRAFVEVEP